MRIIIMSGIPGSGKSSHVLSLVSEKSVVCSADHHFCDNPEHEYRFNPGQLGTAHAKCFRKYLDTLANPGDVDCLVVDNTNISELELAPYVSAAAAYGIIPKIITVWCSPEVASKRNTHGVPAASIHRMHQSLQTRLLPAFWRYTYEDLHF